MGWVDVAIPYIFGMLLVINPRWFLKPKGNGEYDESRIQTFRRIGFLLLGVAAIYTFVKFATERFN